MTAKRNWFLSIVLIAAVALAACGGGGGETARPVIEQDVGPAPQVLVGIDQGAYHDLPVIGERAGVDIRLGTRHDGAGRSTVADYLSSGSEHTAHRFHGAPEVVVIGSSTARERAMVEAAVEAINLSLPLGHRMRIAAPRPDFSLSDTTDGEGYIFYSNEMRPGSIYIEFLPCAAYYDCGGSGATAWSTGGGAGDRRSYIEFARGTFAHGSDRRGSILLAHELLHSLGMDNHVNPHLDSIMRASDHYRSATATILSALDREAMQALYGRVRPGGEPTGFGPWSSTSVHLVGEGRHADFGVALRNGYAEPWAGGAAPLTPLAGNRGLEGTVSWHGALVGFSGRRPVAGDALVSVEIETLTGSAAFTGLESWAEGSQRLVEGTGMTWGDGDLAYSIGVAGNSFRRTGGDEGTLTGVFTGAEHQGAAGVLERRDLTAAFGANR